jgi:hypothetical protein
MPASKHAAADPDAPHWMRYLAMMTGALAAVAGYLTVRNTMLANEAVFHSTQAVLYQAQASDSWAEYQADSIKARVAETAEETDADAASRQKLAQQGQDMRGQQPAARKRAQDFEDRRNAQLTESGRLLFERDILQYAAMATELAIALASVAALTKRRQLFMIGAVVGVVGVSLSGYALVYHYLLNR